MVTHSKVHSNKTAWPNICRSQITRDFNWWLVVPQARKNTYKTVYTKKLYLFEAPQANFFGLMTQAPTFSHDSPRYGGDFRGEFFYEKPGFGGDWGDFGVFCRRWCSPPVRGGDLRVRRGLNLGFRGDWGEKPLRLERGYLRSLSKDNTTNRKSYI